MGEIINRIPTAQAEMYDQFCKAEFAGIRSSINTGMESLQIAIESSRDEMRNMQQQMTTVADSQEIMHRKLFVLNGQRPMALLIEDNAKALKRHILDHKADEEKQKILSQTQQIDIREEEDGREPAQKSTKIGILHGFFTSENMTPMQIVKIGSAWTIILLQLLIILRVFEIGPFRRGLEQDARMSSTEIKLK